MTDKQSYKGSCHCGLVSYTVQVPELTDVKQCNCSMCDRKGYLFIFCGPQDIVFDEGHGEDKLVGYTPGKEYEHKFCPVCGTAVLCRAKSSGGYGINARSLKDVDVWGLKISETYDMRKLNGEYEPPKFTAQEPEDGEGLERLTGSCHCGKVAWVSKTKPLASNFINEHYCSICVRNAYITIYPHASQVSFQGTDNLTTYTFDERAVEHKFCKTCGVPVYGQAAPFNENWSAEKKEAFKQYKDMKLLFLRNVNPPLDFASLQVNKTRN